ncbi:NAD(P)-dependent oxidoreductase [candidate division WOR-3 bacterium]|nr:NAD(P)-dependent oxidoreductase [candidate division WOR-3 bacterium]
MEKIVIIGSEGFTGKVLTSKLQNNNCKLTRVDIVEDNISSDNYLKCDIRNINEVERIPFDEGTTVIHLAARQYRNDVPIRKKRKEFFFETNYKGTKNILEVMEKNKCKNMIYFTTDMVYGKLQETPVKENHPRNPFGPYGMSKVESENLCEQYRKKEFNITIFRPRLIMGPGRLGILKKLFFLIKNNLPVPLIGNGKNYYQMVSVFDCADAIILALKNKIPNENLNLGSDNPPTVENLLKDMINQVNSKSILLKTPALVVKSTLNVLDKIGISLMYPEQFMIADENYLLDISKVKSELGWKPIYDDQDMIKDAFEYYLKYN